MADFDLNITNRQTQDFYIEQTLTLAAGERVQINRVYNYFRVLALSVSTLSVIFGDNPNETPFTGAGLGLALDKTVRNLTLINTGAAPTTITFAVALGKVNDDRLTVSGIVSVLVTGTANVLINNTAAQSVPVRQTSGSISAAQNTVNTTASIISAANTSKNSVTVKNTGSTDMFVGPSTVTAANGFLIEAGGGCASFNIRGALYAITASGSTTASTIEETV